MTLYLIVFLTIFIIAWVGFPLIQAGRSRRLDYELLLERHRSVMNALRDLYDKQAAGEIEGDDFKNIEWGLLKKLAKIERVLGENPEGQGHSRCACGELVKPKYQYCVGCGAAVTHAEQATDGAASAAKQTAESLS